MAENIRNFIDPNGSSPPTSPSQSPQTTPSHSPQTTRRHFTDSDHIYESIDDYRRQSPTPVDKVEGPYGTLKYVANDPPALRPRPQEYFDYANRRFQANTQSRPPSSGNRRSMSFSMRGRPLPPPALTTPQINTGLAPPPSLPPPPSPSPNKSTLDTVLGCPQAMKQWYQRQKTWVKILLAFVAVSILAGFGRLIYCAVTDC